MTGDAPTTSEWSTILLPAKVRLIAEGLSVLDACIYCFSMTVETGNLVFEQMFYQSVT